MTDLYPGGKIVAECFRPKYTVWNPRTVTRDKVMHKRRSRRIYREYLRTGNINAFNRSQRLMTSWDFD